MNDWHAAIAVSLLVHGVVFYADVGVGSQPSLNVKQAPSNIEISLVRARLEGKQETQEIREMVREIVKPEPRPVIKEKVDPPKEKKQQEEEKEQEGEEGDKRRRRRKRRGSRKEEAGDRRRKRENKQTKRNKKGMRNKYR